MSFVERTSSPEVRKVRREKIETDRNFKMMNERLQLQRLQRLASNELITQTSCRRCTLDDSCMQVIAFVPRERDMMSRGWLQGEC